MMIGLISAKSDSRF